jgi:hypothetical protein
MSREKIANDKNSGETGWAGVIRNAEQEIRKARARIFSLQRSIQICQEKLEQNEQWPGGHKTSNTELDQ